MTYYSVIVLSSTATNRIESVSLKCVYLQSYLAFPAFQDHSCSKGNEKSLHLLSSFLSLKLSNCTPVVRVLDNPILNRYPADSVLCFINTYQLDSNLSGG